jgi:SRSO17 transposase
MLECWDPDSQGVHASWMPGDIMMLAMAPAALLLDPDVSAVHGGVASLSDIERRLAPCFERAEPRQRVMASLRGLLSPAERTHSWPLADVSGDATPYGFQPLLRRALWDPDAVRLALRRNVIQHLGASDAVLVIDEPGFLHKGQPSAGVARPYRGTAGNVDHGQLGVLLASASRLGYSLLDRELDLPQAWTTDPVRCRQAGIPDERCCATKPLLAQHLRARAFTAGVPAPRVTGDRVSGDDRWALRSRLCPATQALLAEHCGSVSSCVAFPTADHTATADVMEGMIVKDSHVG